MSSLQKKQQKVREFLATRTISSGMGSRESACSIASINLALTGTLTDKVPPLSSPVACAWVRIIQDHIPHDMRNSSSWKDELLPQLATCGRKEADEQRRIDLIFAWMWTVLAKLQPLANRRGFGAEWRTMVREKTEAASETAELVANVARVTEAAVAAMWVTEAAMWAAMWAAEAVASKTASSSANAAVWAISAIAGKATKKRMSTLWSEISPVILLAQLVKNDATTDK